LPGFFYSFFLLTDIIIHNFEFVTIIIFIGEKMTKYLYISICFILFAVTQKLTVSASELYIYDNYNFILDEDIKIYKDNLYFDKIENVDFLDADNGLLLYNDNNSIWVYYLGDKTKILISESAYNALIYKNNVIYESDLASSYTCKDIIGNISYRNCYKLYFYNIDDATHKMLNLFGNDIYLNDINDDKLVYTSIHNKDEFCNSICSFVNVYDLLEDKNILLDKYEEIILDMSGNGLIDKDILYFESVPNIYGCNFAQIFSYNLLNGNLNLITKTETGCFNKNSETVDVNNGYLLFKSEFENYENTNQINYVYSHFDDKLIQVKNECRYNDTPLIRYENIVCLENENIITNLIDDTAPFINDNKQYIALIENEEKLIQQLEYGDNLSKLENIKVDVISKLDIIGEQLIQIKLCDNFDNCSVNEILVNVIDKDITAPKIYCNESIVLKIGEELIISKYGFAIDNVDGRIPIEIVNGYDINKGGTYILLIKSEDSNGNVGYKEIQLTVYEDLTLSFIYLSILVISFIVIIIIYILRFKKCR